MRRDLSKPLETGLRTFVAIELPAELQADLGQIAPTLSDPGRILKVVAPDLLHLTLRFLGSVPKDRISSIEEASREAAEGPDGFRLSLSQIGSFPGRDRYPRVIWVSLEHDEGYRRLESLQRRLEDALDTRGFGRERKRFSPHLTLARVREGAPLAEVKQIGEAVARMSENRKIEGAFEVEWITVMRSELNPSRPRYTPLAMVPLGLT